MQSQVEKFIDSKNAIIFSLWRKITKSPLKTVSEK